MSKPIDKINILNYLKEHYSEFKNKYNVEQIENDLDKKVDIIREHKN